MRWIPYVAAGAGAALLLTACSGTEGSSATGGSQVHAQSTLFQAGTAVPVDQNVKGPAPAIPGVRKGGILTVRSGIVPESFDPSNQYFNDVNTISQLVMRRLATYRITDGKATLVPDLAESWTEAPDKLSWTFKLKKGIKYEDGTQVTARDFVYGIKRSFATEELPNGPIYQIEHLKGGGVANSAGEVEQTYFGPWKDPKAQFPGVEAVDDFTLKINLVKPWPTLPYFATFTQMSPVPQGKDNRKNYQFHPLATGPYKFASYTPGEALKLVRNDQWDPASDPSRHQNLDGFEFKFDEDMAVAQRAIVDSATPADSASLSWDGVVPEVKADVEGAKSGQLVTGPGPCVNIAPIDTRKISDVRVRRAVAAAYPYDAYHKVTRLAAFDIEPASTFMSPIVPGFTGYAPVEFLGGRGDGDPGRAKQMLKEAGASDFELSWYYNQDSPQSEAGMKILVMAFQDAGFKVKAIGKTRGEFAKAAKSANEPVNLFQGTTGWCFDWPGGDAVYPALFSSLAQKTGNSVGFLSDAALDTEMERVKALPLEQQGGEWTRFDEKLMRDYVPGMPTGYVKGSAVFGTRVRNVVNDPNAGLPDLSVIYIAQ